MIVFATVCLTAGIALPVGFFIGWVLRYRLTAAQLHDTGSLRIDGCLLRPAPERRRHVRLEGLDNA